MIRGVHTMFYSSKPVADHGYGLVTYFRMPGAIEVQLYQPHYSKCG